MSIVKTRLTRQKYVPGAGFGETDGTLESRVVAWDTKLGPNPYIGEEVGANTQVSDWADVKDKTTTATKGDSAT